MGYQESYVHTTCSNVERNNEDIKRFIEIFKKYDVRCERDWLASCIMKLHFNKNIGKYKKGMDILVISGERQAQIDANMLFDIDYRYNEDKVPQYTKEELKLIKRARITFIGDALDVFEAEKDGYSIDVEEISLIPELPSNYSEIKNVFEGTFNDVLNYLSENGNCDIKTKEDLICRYKPRNEKEVKDIVSIMEKAIKSKGYNFECKQKEEKIESYKGSSERIDRLFYINGIRFGNVSYLNWEESYIVNLYETAGQRLRKLCKELLK